MVNSGVKGTTNRWDTIREDVAEEITEAEDEAGAVVVVLDTDMIMSIQIMRRTYR